MTDLAGLLRLPDGIEALVFDMDGVLIDSVSVDDAICRAAALAVLGDGDWLRREAIIENFALHPEPFWAELAPDAPRDLTESELSSLVAHYNTLRGQADFETIPGAVALARAAAEAGLRLAVASSNDVDVVETILAQTGLAERFEVVAGITQNIAGKPAPDIYVDAARKLGLPTEKCAFIEDSVTGLTAGRGAGYGFAIAVATGATGLEALQAPGLADCAFTAFRPPHTRLIDGTPTDKSIETPNDFVSHMVEHIAWRTGTGIDLSWPSTDWAGLGRHLGQSLHGLGLEKASAASLGMIDDGAAECLVDLSAKPGFSFQTHHALDPDRILSTRVEQVGEGRQLTGLLEGLAEGLGGQITIRLCTFEDPHHSWEGVFRALGITINRLRTEP